MKKQKINVIVVGMGFCMEATRRLIAENASLEASMKGGILITTLENINEHEEIMQQRQLSMETILLTAPPKFETEYIPTKREIESYHPFSKFMGRKNKGGKRGRW
jgi:hypothetical protein